MRLLTRFSSAWADRNWRSSSSVRLRLLARAGALKLLEKAPHRRDMRGAELQTRRLGKQFLVGLLKGLLESLAYLGREFGSHPLSLHGGAQNKQGRHQCRRATPAPG